MCGKGNIDDRGVEHLHKGAEHNGDRHKPWIDVGWRVVVIGQFSTLTETVLFSMDFAASSAIRVYEAVLVG